jgi:hypothetical protein
MWTYRLPSQVLFPLRLRCEGCYLSLSEARQVRYPVENHLAGT